MRTITSNPINVIPDLTESDIYKSLIIVTMYSQYMRSQLIAYVIRVPDSTYPRGYKLNWYGGKISDPNLWLWNHHDRGNGNLLKFIDKSWSNWSHTNTTIYICETPEDITEVFTKHDIHNDSILRELQEALCNAPKKDFIPTIRHQPEYGVSVPSVA